jgi:hypothetical protein
LFSPAVAGIFLRNSGERTPGTVLHRQDAKTQGFCFTGRYQIIKIPPRLRAFAVISRKESPIPETCLILAPLFNDYAIKRKPSIS